MKLIYLISRVFLAWTFLNLLAVVSNILLALLCYFTESLYRQCLLDGSWFSCPSLQDDITGTGNENKVGWTNYSLCWTASTQKIMEDLNQKASCPDEASEEAKEVKNMTKISLKRGGIFKKFLDF